MSYRYSEKKLSLESGPAGEKVLLCAIAYPLFRGRGAWKINRYCARFAAVFRRFCAERLTPEALGRLKGGREPARVEMKYRILTNDDDILSLCFDVSAGRRPPRRHASTWNAKNGFPLPLRHFYPGGIGKLQREIAGQIERRLSSGYRVYYKDYAERLKKRLDRDNYYVEGSAVTVFFQPGDLAPASEGRQDFSVAAYLPASRT